MTPLQQQMRKAAADARPVEPGYYDIPSKPLIGTDQSARMADAAYAVVEPLLRELLDALGDDYASYKSLPPEESRGARTLAAINRVREALEYD